MYLTRDPATLLATSLPCQESSFITHDHPSLLVISRPFFWSAYLAHDQRALFGISLYSIETNSFCFLQRNSPKSCCCSLGKQNWPESIKWSKCFFELQPYSIFSIDTIKAEPGPTLTYERCLDQWKSYHRLVCRLHCDLVLHIVHPGDISSLGGVFGIAWLTVTYFDFETWVALLVSSS